MLLLVVEKMADLNFSQLMDVYQEGNLEGAAEFFPNVPENQWPLLAEQSFYQYLREIFFATEGALYAIWVVEGRYVSALRLEPYQDGLLLEALETAPQLRNRGYACALIRAALCYAAGTKVYSHVSKKNHASLAVHKKCGFHRIAEHAVYADGSVLQSSCTLCSNI